MKTSKSCDLIFASPRGGHGRRKILMDSHPYSHKTSIFTLGAPHEKVQGRQTNLHPGFTMVKLVQRLPQASQFFEMPICSVQAVLMMSSRTSS